MLHAKLIDLEKSFNQAPLTQLFSPVLEQKLIKLWVKRDDLIHPVISGNKWRKLKYILDHALNTNSHTIISMGGAYSNHLHALAYTGKQLNINTVGYIRGEKPQKLSQTLQDVQNWGMELRFISRTAYRNLRQYKQFDTLPGILRGEYWLPEGGAVGKALLGVGEIPHETGDDFNTMCVPCGTGTTLAGIIESIPENCRAYGFSALKGGNFLNDDVTKLFSSIHKTHTNWSIHLNYHFGGFAKKNATLISFIECFKKQHNIELEPIYSGKMFYGLFDLIRRNHFEPEQKIIAIHTGGLQGNRV